MATSGGLLGTAMLLEAATISAPAIYLVPSRSDPGTCHRVVVLPHGSTSCPCVAGGYGNACGHAGAVIAHLETEEQWLDPRACQVSHDYLRWYMWRAGWLAQLPDAEGAP